MEKQEIFTQVVKHLFKQGYKSEGWLDPDTADDPGCLYRAEDGGRCAVGYFIPDDVYSVCMEGKSVSVLWNTWQDKLPAWMGDNIELLTDLQNVHDTAEVQYDGKLFVMDELRRNLLRVMGKYQLEWPVVYSNLDALDALQERLNLAHEAATNSQ